MKLLLPMRQEDKQKCLKKQHNCLILMKRGALPLFFFCQNKKASYKKSIERRKYHGSSKEKSL